MQQGLVSSFLTGFAMSAALIIAIGGQNIFVLRQGLRREHVGPIVVFCGLSDAFLISAGVGGLGIFLAVIPALAKLLAGGGSIFLACYGLVALRRSFRPSSLTAAGETGVSLQGAIAGVAAFTFLNPHVYLDTVLLMGSAGSAFPPAGRYTFVAGATTASF